MNKDLETCKSLAEQLGAPYTAMRVGKIRNAVCSDKDMEGRYIKPSGVLKITASISKEMDIIETASPDIVRVKVLHHKSGNPVIIFAKDLETLGKVAIQIPRREKQILSTVGKVLTVERGLIDGKAIYRYPVSKSKQINR
jgi:hypothetical protein